MSTSTRTVKLNFPKMGKFTFPLLPGSVEVTCICSTVHFKGRKLGPRTLRTPVFYFSFCRASEG